MKSCNLWGCGTSILASLCPRSHPRNQEVRKLLDEDDNLHGFCLLLCLKQSLTRPCLSWPWSINPFFFYWTLSSIPQAFTLSSEMQKWCYKLLCETIVRWVKQLNLLEMSLPLRMKQILSTEAAKCAIWLFRPHAKIMRTCYCHCLLPLGII